MKPQRLRKSQRSTRRQLRFETNKAFRLYSAAMQRQWDKKHRFGPSIYYILRGKEVVPVRNLLRWGRWFEKERYPIGRDYIGDVRVSTIFLGLDHGWFDSPPVIFETMIFGGEYNERMFRFKTWDEARQAHIAIVETLKTDKLLGETLDELGIGGA